MDNTPIEELETKLIREFLLAHPYIEKSERDRVLKSERHSDDLKSLISIYPEKNQIYSPVIRLIL